jgi:hypothetical protein
MGMRKNKLFAVLMVSIAASSMAPLQALGASIFDFGNNVVAPGGERIVPFFITIHIDQDFFNSAPGTGRWANFALRFKYDAGKMDLLLGETRMSTLADGVVFWQWGPILQPGVNGLGAIQKKVESGKIVIEVGVGNASNNNTLLAGHFFGSEDPDTGNFVPMRWIVKTDNFAHGETYLIETSVMGAGQMAKTNPTRISPIALQGGFTVPEPGSWIALLAGLGGLWRSIKRTCSSSA